MTVANNTISIGYIPPGFHTQTPTRVTSAVNLYDTMITTCTVEDNTFINLDPDGNTSDPERNAGLTYENSPPATPRSDEHHPARQHVRGHVGAVRRMETGRVTTS